MYQWLSKKTLRWFDCEVRIRSAIFGAMELVVQTRLGDSFETNQKQKVSSYSTIGYNKQFNKVSCGFVWRYIKVELVIWFANQQIPASMWIKGKSVVQILFKCDWHAQPFKRCFCLIWRKILERILHAWIETFPTPSALHSSYLPILSIQLYIRMSTVHDYAVYCTFYSSIQTVFQRVTPTSFSVLGDCAKQHMLTKSPEQFSVSGLFVWLWKVQGLWYTCALAMTEWCQKIMRVRLDALWTPRPLQMWAVCTINLQLPSLWPFAQARCE